MLSTRTAHKRRRRFPDAKGKQQTHCAAGALRENGDCAVSGSQSEERQLFEHQPREASLRHCTWGWRSFGEIVSTISRISQFATAKAFGCVPDTLENRQARIFRKGGIRFREFTTIECRSAIRLNSLCVHAIEAQPYAPLFILGTCGFRHILQDNLPRNSHHAFRYTYRFHTNST